MNPSTLLEIANFESIEAASSELLESDSYESSLIFVVGLITLIFIDYLFYSLGADN